MSDDEETIGLASRRGKFTMALPVVLEAPELVIKVLAGILVTSCECRFTDHTLCYGGISEHFEPVEDGEEAPSYDVAWDDETQTATWSVITA